MEDAAAAGAALAADHRLRVMHPAALLALVLVPALALRQSWPLDELRYLEVVREMLERGDPFTLTLEGRTYTEKAPLLFWEVALVGKLVGMELASRLVPALHAAVAIAALGRLARVVTGDAAAARLAGCLAAVSPATLVLGQTFLFDMPLASFVLLADAAAVGALAAARPVPWSAWLFVGLAAFTKGPVAFVHTLPVIAVAAHHVGGLRAWLPSWRWLVAALLALGPLAAWAFLHSARVEGSAENLLRQVTGRLAGTHGHVRPWHLYPIALGFAALPWLLDVRRPRAAPTLATKLALTALVVAGTFALVPTRAAQYVYPSFLCCLPWVALGVRPAMPFGTGLVRAIALACAGLALAVAAGAFRVDAWLAEHGGRNGAVLALDFAEATPIWVWLAVPAFLLVAFVRISLPTRTALLFAVAALAALPTLNRCWLPERTLPLLRAHAAQGGLVVQHLPVFAGNFHWFLRKSDLAVAPDAGTLARLVAGQDALLFGFEKQVPGEIEGHTLALVARESLFFRAFCVWRIVPKPRRLRTPRQRAATSPRQRTSADRASTRASNARRSARRSRSRTRRARCRS